MLLTYRRLFPTLKLSHMTVLSARVTKPHESLLEAEERRQTEKKFCVYRHSRQSLNAVKVIGVKGQKVQDKRASVGQ